jgi:hypothetical protein
MALVTGDNAGLDVKARSALAVYRVRRPHLEALLGPVDTSLERAAHLRCLATVPLLRNMSAGELLRLLNLFQPRSYSAGEAVLRKGEPALRIHLLITGTVAVVAQDPDTGQVRKLCCYAIHSANIVMCGFDVSVMMIMWMRSSFIVGAVY